MAHGLAGPAARHGRSPGEHHPRPRRDGKGAGGAGGGLARGARAAGAAGAGRRVRRLHRRVAAPGGPVPARAARPMTATVVATIGHGSTSLWYLTRAAGLVSLVLLSATVV